MTRAIDRSKYGTRGVVQPKLLPASIPDSLWISDANGRKWVVLTVHKVQEFQGTDGPFLSIITSEFPEMNLDNNSTQEDALLALVDAKKLPNDFDAWAGKRIPFYQKENVFSGRGKGGTEAEVRAVKLYALDPEDYDAALKQWDATKGGAPAAQPPAPAARKGTSRSSAR
jgi:hypothetical protein